MAISRDKKQALVAELAEALTNSRLTVFAAYQGLSVADMQELRAKAREAGVQIKVAKNRLVRVALSSVDQLKDVDTSELKGQLLYATSAEDEVSSARVLNDFSKSFSSLQIVGGISAEAKLLGVDEVKSLADLPSKEELIAQTIEQLLSPVHEITNGLSGNLHGLLDGIEAKASAA
ncbi:50S ribosomal protein L10 [Candidatus Saccharibacteria bacterium]|nr:MAG: 50S ribosomal protein L10 [Candidatus Saccharibacteria bacterium]